MLFCILKRITDIILSSFLITVSFPFISLYSLIVLLFWKVNPFFIQERAVGIRCGSFSIVKIRTLKPGTLVRIIDETRLVESSDFLPLGRFLRRTGLDELPQLLLVFSGKMSIIGPRPLMMEDITMIADKYPGLMEQRSRMQCLPGISGLWQLKRSSAVSYDELDIYDLEYASKRSILFDWRMIGLTALKMLQGYHLDALQSIQKTKVNSRIITGYQVTTPES